MATREFPALQFDPAPGDAEALGSAARDVGAAGRLFSDAAGNVSRLNSSAWTGDAADAFRGQLADLPRDLDLAARSHQTAAGALSEFRDGLVARQRRATELEAQAEDLRRRQATAIAEVNRLAGQTAPSGSAEFTDLKNRYDAARSRATTLGSDLQAVLDAARRLHREHDSAASAAAGKIRGVANAPYKEPGWLSRGWNAVKGWIGDHADVLTEISTVLKGVSAVLGVLSLVPGLQFLAPFALLAAGAALVIDVGIKVATGKGSWAAIGIDAALTFIPGGKILSGLKGAKAAVAGERGLAAGERALVSGERALAGGERALQGGERALATTGKTSDEVRTAAVSAEKRILREDPIDVVTGVMVMRQIDVDLAGALPLILARTYVSSYRVGRSFGPGWASTLDQRVEPDGDVVRYADDDGTVLVYPAPTGSEPVLPVEGPRLPLAVDAGGWTITRPDGRTLRFGPDGLLASVTDRVGTSRIDVERDDAGTPVELRHTGGYRIAVDSERGLVTALRLRDGGRWTDLVRFGYDAGGRLAAVVNSSGIPLRFRSDDEGRIVRWDDRNGVWYVYEYDEAGRCVRTTGADGALSVTFAYSDGATTMTDSLGARTRFEYNGLKQLVREVDPLGHATVSEWDRYDRLLSRTDPLGHTTRWSYDGSGNLVRVERPDGAVTTADHDAAGRPVRVVEPDGAVWGYSYDERGLLVSVTDPVGATTRYGHDEAGHLTSVVDALRRLRHVRNDAAGLPVEETDTTGAVTRYRRDAFGRIVAITDPLGAETALEWTVEGKLAARTGPDGATERWRYDGEGNEIEHVDALGQVTRAEITGFDLLAARIAPDGARTTYGYDTELRLTTVTDPQGLVWRYDYDPAGRLVRETDYDGRGISYGYDPAGRLAERAVDGTAPVRCTRDAAGRLLSREVDGAVTTFRYDRAGRLAGATGGDGTALEVTRDRLGRVVAETVDGRTLASRYDLLGRRTWRRTPAGAETAWEYGPDDLPVALHAGPQTVHFDRDVLGRERHRRLAGGATLELTYDPASRLAGQALTAPDVAGRHRLVGRRTFGYRPDGVLAATDDLVTGPRRFELDGGGRVTAVRGTDERYAYGPTGALVGAGDGGPWSYAGTRLQRAGNVRYEHDAAGRVVLRQHRTLSGQVRTWRYSWDGLDRLVAVETPDGTRWRYRYDPLGRRVAKVRLDASGAAAEEVLFTWDGTALAEQTTAGGATVWDWDETGRRPLDQRELTQDEVDERFYGIVTDLVGAPTELYDPDGTIAWRASTTIWGSTVGTGTAACPLRFPGQYEDAETGLHYNYFRYYDPRTGRYTSPDPVGLSGGPDPAAYVSNPTVWTDPLGLTPCKADFIVGSDGTTVPVSQSRMRTGLDAAADNAAETGVTRFPTKSAGVGYELPDGTRVRLMEPTPYAGRRASFENANGQPIDPFTGRQPIPPKGVTGKAHQTYVREHSHVEQTP